MNENQYRSLYDELHCQFVAFCQEITARMLAFEEQLADMRADQHYEREVRLSNADTQEFPTVDWSDEHED